jgi:hypothetical protein
VVALYKEGKGEKKLSGCVREQENQRLFHAIPAINGSVGVAHPMLSVDSLDCASSSKAEAKPQVPFEFERLASASSESSELIEKQSPEDRKPSRNDA